MIARSSRGFLLFAHVSYDGRPVLRVGWQPARVAARRFQEVAEALASEIAALPPGSRVPTEHEVADGFAVGRSTARAALQDLERRLLVRRISGRGAFTARRVDYRVCSVRPAPWSHTVVRACDPAPLPRDVAAVLDRDPGETAHRLARRSFTDDLPAAWGIDWVPFVVLPELATACRVRDSLDAILRDVAGVDPVHGWARASVETAADEVVDQLGVETGDPVWFVESTTADSGCSADGRPLVLSRRWLRPDAVRLVLEA